MSFLSKLMGGTDVVYGGIMIALAVVSLMIIVYIVVVSQDPLAPKYTLGQTLIALVPGLIGLFIAYSLFAGGKCLWNRKDE